MLRRVHVKSIQLGDISLEAEAAHHLRDVLRLEVGAELELFDDAGTTASSTIIHCGMAELTVRVNQIHARNDRRFTLTVASAIPKANRADWMIEKLSELGVDRFVPLQTARSVVHPEGKNKIERWERLAVEASRQSRRRGVMAVSRLMHIDEWITSFEINKTIPAWYFSTATDSRPAVDLLKQPLMSDGLTLLVGPEGGWSPQEVAVFTQAGVVAVGLTDTILRIETAALAAAAIVMVSRPDLLA